jgi:hypothetical protein
VPNYIRRYAPGGTFFIHYNPVKHGLTRCPHQWPHSTFRRWGDEGYYREDWLCDCDGKAATVSGNLRVDPTFGE